MNTHTIEAKSGATSTTHGTPTTTERTAHPPSPLDRVALRIGVALIIWSRRSYRPGPTRDELVRRHANRLAQERRERDYRSRQSLVVVDR